MWTLLVQWTETGVHTESPDPQWLLLPLLHCWWNSCGQNPRAVCNVDKTHVCGRWVMGRRMKKITDVMFYQYHSLAKKHPPPTFGPISCIAPSLLELAPWYKLSKCICRVWEAQLKALCISEARKLCVILHRRLLQWSLGCTDVANAVCTASYTMLMVPFRVLCASGHNLEA